MWKPIKEFFTHNPFRGRVNIHHEDYLEKNLRRVDKKDICGIGRTPMKMWQPEYVDGIDPIRTSCTPTDSATIYIYKGGTSPTSTDHTTTTL